MTRACATNPRPTRGAFTVLELVIVLGVVAILMGLILGVGPRVVENQRKQATTTLLLALDRILDEYMQENNGLAPRYNPFDYEFIPGRRFAEPTSPEQIPEQYPPSSSSEHVRHPDAAVFLRQTSLTLGADAITRAIPERYIVRTSIFQDAEGEEIGLGALTILDAWGEVERGWSARGADFSTPTGQPPDDRAWPVYGATFIHYVHPENELAQELYGRCVNNRPYFFSAGPDRRYGVTNQFNRANPGVRNSQFTDNALRALEDNIYSYEPGPVNRTAGFGTSTR